MNDPRTVVVAGASGVIGLAATNRLVRRGATVLALSRRAPFASGAAQHVPVDLADSNACRSFAAQHRDVTQLVYAAVKEAPGLIVGWSDPELIRANTTMFVGLLDALVEHAPGLRHVTLLQGTKAYGVHLDRSVAIPLRESSPRHPHANFYFTQEDALRERAADRGFTFTILRPQIVFGEALGSNMNPLAAIGAYGALLAAEGAPLHYPGGLRHVSEAVDADLVAEVVDWCSEAPAAAGETFNVANGDVFTWPDIWPVCASALDMELGESRPQSLVAFFASRKRLWSELVDRHQLHAPRELDEFLGQSAIYADMLLDRGRTVTGIPVLTSTIKLREAGFGACIDTAKMVSRLLGRLRDQRLLPVR